MILVKGDEVGFGTVDATDPNQPDLMLPKRYGIIHDPTGKALPRCTVYFGPARKNLRGRALMTPEAKRYFGSAYKPTAVTVKRPGTKWEPVAYVARIFYVRRGRAAGGYHHTFRGQPLLLERAGLFYRLSLPGNCIVDDRGFVFP